MKISSRAIFCKARGEAGSNSQHWLFDGGREVRLEQILCLSCEILSWRAVLLDGKASQVRRLPSMWTDQKLTNCNGTWYTVGWSLHRNLKRSLSYLTAGSAGHVGHPMSSAIHLTSLWIGVQQGLVTSSRNRWTWQSWCSMAVQLALEQLGEMVFDAMTGWFSSLQRPGWQTKASREWWLWSNLRCTQTLDIFRLSLLSLLRNMKQPWNTVILFCIRKSSWQRCWCSWGCDWSRPSTTWFVDWIAKNCRTEKWILYPNTDHTVSRDFQTCGLCFSGSQVVQARCQLLVSQTLSMPWNALGFWATAIFHPVGETLEFQGITWWNHHRTIMAAEPLLFATKCQLWQSPPGPIWVYAGFTVRQRHSCIDSVHFFTNESCGRAGRALSFCKVWLLI